MSASSQLSSACAKSAYSGSRSTSRSAAPRIAPHSLRSSPPGALPQSSYSPARAYLVRGPWETAAAGANASRHAAATSTSC